VDVLVLGGTAWLGREVARQALAAGHRVSCLARGQSGPVSPGAQFVEADRARPDAYASVAAHDWDWVLDVSWQPRWVREALAVLSARTRLWTYVSSGNVYARNDVIGADETAPLLAPTDQDVAELAQYGPAKVACELAARTSVGDRLLIARAGLIGGPGDISGRSGYWVARASGNRDASLLVPDSPDAPTQVIDVRDLAAWLVRCAEGGIVGTYNAVGPVVGFGAWIELCRQVADHTGTVVRAEPHWLIEQGVEQYMGANSMPMWIVDESHAGWSSRSGAAALDAGLTHRPRRDLLSDLLIWELEQGLDRDRNCGLPPERESNLLTMLTGR
jgi:2'-hydroxyisoflavone reductase